MKRVAVGLAVFDLDGTLADTKADIAAATNRVLAAAGLPPHPLEAFDAFVGAGVSALIAAAAPQLSASEHVDLERAFRRDYAGNLVVSTVLFPGIRAAIDRLLAASVCIAVLSNKPHQLTTRVVDVLLPDLATRLTAVLGQRDGIARKPDPQALLEICERAGIEPARAAMVGDTPIDIETAVRAGALPLGVAWGFRPTQELFAAGAYAVASDAHELADRILTTS